MLVATCLRLYMKVLPVVFAHAVGIALPQTIPPVIVIGLGGVIVSLGEPVPSFILYHASGVGALEALAYTLSISVCVSAERHSLKSFVNPAHLFGALPPFNVILAVPPLRFADIVPVTVSLSLRTPSI